MIYNGDLFIDDRGFIISANDFDFSTIKRFYVVSNHSKRFMRGWHGHRQETKYAYVIRGVVKVGIINMDDTTKSTTHILSAVKPQILTIPPGYYNGFKTLTEDALIMFFSDKTLEESQYDDFRKPIGLWNILEVKQR